MRTCLKSRIAPSLLNAARLVRGLHRQQNGVTVGVCILAAVAALVSTRTLRAQPAGYSEVFSFNVRFTSAEIKSLPVPVLRISCQLGGPLGDATVSLNLTQSPVQGWIGEAIVTSPGGSFSSTLRPPEPCAETFVTVRSVAGIRVPVQENVEGTQVGGAVQECPVQGCLGQPLRTISVMCSWTGTNCSALGLHVREVLGVGLPPLLIGQREYSVLGSFEREEPVDLRVVSILPVQVVFGADLVRGKSTAFEVTLGATSLSPLPAAVGLNLTFEGKTYSQSVGKDKFVGGAELFEAKVFVNPTPKIRPASKGLATVFVEVDPERLVAEVNEGDNTRELEIKVMETVPLKVAHFAVKGCLPFGGCYGPPTEIDDSVKIGNDFIQATYPVAAYSGPLVPVGFFGNPLPLVGLVPDLLSLAVWGELANIAADATIGIVPRDYFPFHTKGDATGFAFSGFPAGLVVEGHWSTAAHELGHVYGLAPAPEEEEYDEVFPGRSASGYFVDGNILVEQSICFMGTSPDHPGFLDRWIDAGHYVQLQHELRAFPDPELLLVTGLLHSSGRLELQPWYFRPEGRITQSRPGDGVVRVRDASGQILAEVTFPISFTAFVEPFGAQPTDIVPLFIKVPYPDGATSIEILHANQVLARVSPAIKLLHDAINAIPGSGFNQTPTQLRQALHNRVGAIERMLAEGAMVGGQHALIALRSTLVEWLREGYMTVVPTELTKNEILRVVDEVIEHIH